MANLRIFWALLLSILVSGFLSSGEALRSPEDDEECQQNTMKKIDQYLSELDIVPSSNKRHFPETLEKLKQSCKTNAKIINFIDILVNRCLSGFKQNLMRITLYSIKNSQKVLCKRRPTNEMRAFVNAGKCINTGRPKFRHCIQTAAQNIYGMKMMPEKLRIPLICCEIYRTKECLLDEAKGVKECTDGNVETLQSRFNHAASNTMSFACGEYTEDSDKCFKLRAPENIKQLAPNRSIVSVLFELLDYLPGEQFDV